MITIGWKLTTNTSATLQGWSMLSLRSFEREIFLFSTLLNLVLFYFSVVFIFAYKSFTKTDSSQGKPVCVDDRKRWVRGASVWLLKGHNTCVLCAPSSSDLQILFSFFTDVWRTTLHSRRTQGVDERRMHSSTYCSLHSAYEWKKPLLCCPTHLHIELLKTFPLGFLERTPLHCPTKSHGVQSRHFCIWLLICSVLLLWLFPLLSSVPFNFLTSFWYSFCYVYCVSLFHFYLGFFPFYASFPWEKGDVPL